MIIKVLKNSISLIRHAQLMLAVMAITIRHPHNPLLLSILDHLKLFHYQNSVMNMDAFQKPPGTAASVLEDSKVIKRVALDEAGSLTLERNREMNDYNHQRPGGEVCSQRDGENQLGR